jgi:prepilin-type N-terminal cleavage/methylation domain-containing protein
MYTWRRNNVDGCEGFSLIELLLSMVITLIILGVAVTVFSTALGRRSREASRADAITSAEAALNIMSREIGNAGYGLETNGIVAADSTATKLHFRANIVNQANNNTTSDPGEDIVFYLDGTGSDRSVVRHDNNTGETSGIINRISSVNFEYQNYVNSGSVPVGPGPSTGKIKITLTVILANVEGQPSEQTITVSSEVTLRNSPYMRGQY